jgi:serine phosphatase RsbU (regulator of sigma subunit)
MTTTTTTTASTAPAPLLDYPSAPVSTPTDFDLALHSERTRWIRRRFLWFCGISVLLHVIISWGSFDRNAPALARALAVADAVLVLGSYAAAFAYALFARPTLPGLLRLGLYVTAILPTVSMLIMRADISINPDAWEWKADFAHAGTCFAVGAPLAVLIYFTVACAFIPWSAREALRPAAVMVTTLAGVVTADLLLTIKDTEGRVIAGAFLTASPLAVAPGLLTCWWRNSRFRARFKLLFESSSYRQLQSELAGARRIHESTLPPPDRFTAGPLRLAFVYEPMRQIGGDILYVHPPDQPHAARVSLVLVDVNGHGFGAALMANRVIGETQRLFAENPDAAPHEILTALNRYVRLTLARDAVFATALCLRADADANTLEYANGGHPPAFLRRPDGSVTRLDSDTYLLGVHDGDDYCPRCQRAEFRSGDALLAYTDGATEARDPAGQMLTIHGLTHLLNQIQTPPATWPTTLLSQVVAHRRAPADDDTLLVTLYRP